VRQSNALALSVASVVLGACGRTPVGTGVAENHANAESLREVPSGQNPLDVASAKGAMPGISNVRLPAPPAEGAPGSRIRASERPSDAGAFAGPGAPPLRNGPSVDCYDHFVPSEVPHVDVLRLGMSCGPSNGLTLIGSMTGAVDEARAPALYQWDAERHDCFRLFAVAAEPVEDLEVEIVFVAPHAERVSLTNQNRRWAVVDEDGPFCAPHAGTYEARFSTHGGHGRLAAAVWKGARMGAARGKLDRQ